MLVTALVQQPDTPDHWYVQGGLENRPASRDWLSSSVPGYCALTKQGDNGDCGRGDSGSFILNSTAVVRDRDDNVTIWEVWVDACLQAGPLRTAIGERLFCRTQGASGAEAEG